MEPAQLIYALWHGLFCCFIVAYADIVHTARDAPLNETQVRRAILLGVTGGLALAAVGTMFALRGFWVLPALVDGDSYTDTVRDLSGPAWLLCAASLGFLYWRTRGRTVLDLWLL